MNNVIRQQQRARVDIIRHAAAGGTEQNPVNPQSCSYSDYDCNIGRGNILVEMTSSAE